MEGSLVRESLSIGLLADGAKKPQTPRIVEAMIMPTSQPLCRDKSQAQCMEAHTHNH
jgi:hypothetical protein